MLIGNAFYYKMKHNAWIVQQNFDANIPFTSVCAPAPNEVVHWICTNGPKVDEIQVGTEVMKRYGDEGSVRDAIGGIPHAVRP